MTDDRFFLAKWWAGRPHLLPAHFKILMNLYKSFPFLVPLLPPSFLRRPKLTP